MSTSEGWKLEINELFGSQIDCSTSISFLQSLFKYSITPTFYIDNNDKIFLPDKYSIQMTGNQNILILLMNTDLFFSLPYILQKNILTILFLLFQRDQYDIIKFSYGLDLVDSTSIMNNSVLSSSSTALISSSSSSNNMNRKFFLSKIFLKLLIKMNELNSTNNNLNFSSTITSFNSTSISYTYDVIPLDIYELVIHNLGLVSSVGILTEDLFIFLSLLKSPSLITNYLLQALHTMFVNDLNSSTHLIPSTFNFGGFGSGLYVNPTTACFPKEYQFALWFRLDYYNQPLILNNHHNEEHLPHLFSWKWSNNLYELNLFFCDNELILSVRFGKNDIQYYNVSSSIATSNSNSSTLSYNSIHSIPLKSPNSFYFRNGLWYHLSLSHSKSKLLDFSKEKLIIYIDGKEVFKTSVKYPFNNSTNTYEMDLMIGKHLNGNIGNAYLFHEGLSNKDLITLKNIDSTCSTSLERNNLLDNHTTLALYPSRCVSKYCLDIISDLYAVIGDLTQPWEILNPRDLLLTMGGINALLPLFPRLLIEGEDSEDKEKDKSNYINSPSSSPNSPSTALNYSISSPTISPINSYQTSPYFLNSPTNSGDNSLENSLSNNLLKFAQSKQDFLRQPSGRIGLLFLVLAKSIRQNRFYQLELLNGGGIEMLEYVLKCLTADCLLQETEKTIDSLLSFKSSASNVIKALDFHISKLLLFNINIWKNSQYNLLYKLFNLLLSEVHKDPKTYLKLLGVSTIIEAIDFFSELDLIDEENPNIFNEDIYNIKQIGFNDEAQLTSENDEKKIESSFSSSISVSSTPISSSTSPFKKSNKKMNQRKSFYDLTKNISNALEEKSKDSYLNPAIIIDEDDEEDEEESLDEDDNSEQEKISNNDNINEINSTTLPITQRRTLRHILSTILIILLKNNKSDNELVYLFDYMNFCRDKTLLNEFTLILIYLLSSQNDSTSSFSSSNFIINIINACGSIEEFVSFVLLNLIHQPDHEELRCNALKLLTQFFLRLPVNLLHSSSFSSSISSTTSSSGPASILSRARAGTISITNNLENSSSFPSFTSSNTPSTLEGFKKFQTCGGLALLCEIINSHSKFSTFLTYFSLLDLVFATTYNTKQYNINLNSFLNNSYNSSNSLLTLLLDLPPLPLAHYLEYDLNDTSSTSLTNPYTLPVLFDLLPSLPLELHPTLYTDLLSILKRHASDRDAFLACPSWHVCLYNMVSQLLSPEILRNSKIFLEKNKNKNDKETNESILSKQLNSLIFIHHYDFFPALEKFSTPLYENTPSSPISSIISSPSSSLISSPLQKTTRCRSYTESEVLKSIWENNENEESHIYDEQDKYKSKKRNDAITSSLKEFLSKEDQLDFLFELGMKVYSTMLIHAMETKDGWKDIFLSILPSLNGPVGFSISKSILNYFLNDLIGKSEHFISTFTYNNSDSNSTPTNSSNSSTLQITSSLAENARNYYLAYLVVSQVCLLNTRSIVSVINTEDISHTSVDDTFPSSFSQSDLEKKNEVSQILELEVQDEKQNESIKETNTIEDHLHLHFFHYDIICRNRLDFYNEIAKNFLAQKFHLFLKPSNPNQTSTNPTVNPPKLYQDRINDKELTESFDNEELKEILNLTENQLTNYINRKKDSDNNFSDEFSEYLDFSYSWQEIDGAPTSVKKLLYNKYSHSLTSTFSTEIDGDETNTKSIVDELLHPLGRFHSSNYKTLILALQCLRIFDFSFWPIADGPLRNTDKLKFSKDTLTNSSSSSTNSASLMNSSNSQGQNTINKVVYLTIFSSTLRMCYYTLTTLSPLSHLSVWNLKRITAMIEAIDKVSLSRPQDWLNVTFAHLFIHVQRLINLLVPVFKNISLPLDVSNIKTIGPWDYEKFYTESPSPFFPSSEFSKSISIIASNKELCNYLETLFNSSSGRNLLRNLKNSLNIFLCYSEIHKSKIGNILECELLKSFEVFIENLKADLRVMSDSDKKKEVVSVDTQELNNTDLNIGESSSTPSAPSPVSAFQFSPLSSPISTFKKKLSSDTTSSTSTEIAQNNSFFPFGRKNQINQTPSGQVFTSSIENEFLYQNSILLKESFTAREILQLFNWLGFSFFQLNIFSSIRILNSFKFLDMNEAISMNTFMQDAVHIKNELKKSHLEFSHKATEDMTILKQTSLKLNDSIQDRIKHRMKSLKIKDNLKVKNAAAKWHACLQLFKSSWSPWRSDYDLSTIQLLNKENNYLVLNSTNNSEKANSLLENDMLDSSLSSTNQNLIENGPFLPENSQESSPNEISLSNPDFVDKPLSISSSSSDTFEIFSPTPNNNNSNIPTFYTSHNFPYTTTAISYTELARHRDFRFRNMLLTKLPDPIDHKNAAHVDSKLKDQILYEASLQGIDPSEIDIEEKIKELQASTSATSSNNKNLEDIDHESHTGIENFAAALTGKISITNLNKIPPNSALKPLQNQNDEDEDEDDEEEEIENEKNRPKVIENVSRTLNSLFFNSENSRPPWAQFYHWTSDEKILFLNDATLIQLDQVIAGSLLLTNKCLYFHCKKRMGGLANSSKPFYDRRLPLDRLVEVYNRRYLLQNSAIELFFADAPELFLAFNRPAILKKFFNALKKQSTPLLQTPKSLNCRSLFKQSDWTNLWRKRLISNFEYLMRLNILAGRSYNDITQYPVFPWILADYESKKLDLKNEKSFRQLHLPVGALNPTRLKDFLERYRTFDDDVVPKFMYGSHYSSAGVVLHYMIRQEPFTTLAINLQSGRFDCPDRIFFDIRRTWIGCNNSMSDVKELIPELFCCPEILINNNKLPLGELQDGGEVNHVVLPPWANNSPYEFIRLNREALESDYVSDHLHEWIDLIFGCNQVGENAVAAHNVFYYLTYEGAVDIDSIEDKLQRDATKAQVTHFGQTPSQLLTEKHPMRLPKDQCIFPLCYDESSIFHIKIYSHPSLESLISTEKSSNLEDSVHKDKENKPSSVISLSCMNDKLIVIYSNLSVAYFKWNNQINEKFPFSITYEKTKILSTSHLTMSQELFSSQINSLLFNLPAYNTSSFSSPNPRISISRSIFRPTSIKGLNILSGNSGNNNSNNNSIDKPKKVSKWNFPFGKSSSSNAPPALTSTSTGSTQVSAISTDDSSTDFDSYNDGKSSDPNSSSTFTNPIVLSGANTMGISSLSTKHVGFFSSDFLSTSRIITCGYWDQTIKIHSLDMLKELPSSSGHIGSITCMHIGNNKSNFIVSGGYDGTLRVWVVEKPSLATAFRQESFNGEAMYENIIKEMSENLTNVSNASTTNTSPLICVNVLYGHSHPITSIFYSPDLDLVLSSDTTGLLCLHTVRRGMYIRSLDHMVTCPSTFPSSFNQVEVLLATNSGYLLAHSWTTLELIVMWINGQLLRTITLSEKIECMISSPTGNHIICGTANGYISFRQAWDLEEVHSIEISKGVPVKSLVLSEDNQFLFIGMNDGSVRIATDSDMRSRYFRLNHNKTL